MRSHLSNRSILKMPILSKSQKRVMFCQEFDQILCNDDLHEIFKPSSSKELFTDLKCASSDSKSKIHS